MNRFVRGRSKAALYLSLFRERLTCYFRTVHPCNYCTTSQKRTKLITQPIVRLECTLCCPNIFNLFRIYRSNNAIRSKYLPRGCVSELISSSSTTITRRSVIRQSTWIFTRRRTIIEIREEYALEQSLVVDVKM